ncbi:MAG: F0F1 ATP synthase subunit B [Rhodospirillales bacterium]|jgi:F-type H+-transporting ATPase subunit b|nr:F0F1 ATP synthase subunit B [Rhodospirillales bacterium]
MHHHYEHFWLDPKFWVAVSFAVFAALAIKLAWGKVTAMLDGRGQRISAELAEAARLRQEAEDMLRQAEAERQAAMAEAEALIERAKAEAERVAATAAADAQAQAARREKMAMDRIAAAEASAVAEVRNAAAEVATIAARNLIAESFSAEDDAAMIDQAVTELPKALRAA